MFVKPRITTLAFILIIFLSACATHPSHIQTDVVPAESLRVAQVVAIATREEILKLEAYKSIIASGVADSDVVDGSMVAARVYCCGGISKELSSEYVHRIFLYVPKGLNIAIGDFIEARVARLPPNGGNGSVNTVTRVVDKHDDKSESCWWDPKDDSLWLRVPYCDWMPSEGWLTQGGLYPDWYKPYLNNSIASEETSSATLPGTASFLLLDKRALQQKLSHKETDSNGTNSYLGDNSLNPTGPESLKTALQRKLKTALSGTSITLTDFSVTVYEPSVSLPYGGGAYGEPDPLTKLIVLGIEKLKSEKTVLVQVTGKIGETSFSGSTSENYKGVVTDGNIRAVVDKTLEDVVSQIQSIVDAK